MNNLSPSSPKSILLISTMRFGDCLLFTPVVRSVREAYPEAQIDVLVSREGHLVFDGNPDVDNVLYMSKRPSMGEYLKFIWNNWRKYDLVVNDRVSDKPALYAWVSGKHRVGFINPQASNTKLLKALYHDWVEDPQPPVHRVARNLLLTHLLNIEPVTDIVAPECDSALPIELPEHYVVVHIPSSSDFKQWPTQHWQTLCNALLSEGYFLVFTGSKSERDQSLIREVLSELSSFSHQWMDVSTALTLAQAGQVMKHSMGFIGPDSGPAHLASAFSIPQVVLFGPTPPSTWAPWPFQLPLEPMPFSSLKREQTVGNITVLQAKLDCVSCYAKQCGVTQSMRSECMNQIDPGRVFAAVTRVIPLYYRQTHTGASYR